MSQLWTVVAWLLSLLAPSDAVETARCAACVTVAYAAQAKSDGPTPPEPGPRPDGCVEGCKCGGTGWVTSPEGFKVPCPCPVECKCKQAKRGEK